ncbi:MAG: AI-2E family transporter [Saprospiraceae bacterium]
MQFNKRVLAITAGVLAAALFVYFFSNIVVYVAIAWVLSLILEPLVRFFHKHLKIKKFQVGITFCAILAMLVFFAGLSLIVLLFVPLIVQQANNLASVDYQAVAAALQEPLAHLQEWLVGRGFVEPEPSLDIQLQDALRSSEYFQPGNIGGFFSSIVSATGSVLAGFFSVVFITFFFLQDETMLPDFMVGILPNEYEERVRHAFYETDRMLTRYFNGVLLQVSVLTVFMWLVLRILGIENALLIAFFGALVNLIPYVGPFIGAVFGLFITVSSHLELSFYTEMLPMLLKVLGAFIVMQWLDNYFLQPYIFSKSVKAHPLEIFIVILMGATISGVLGMVLAIPVYTVLRVIARTFWSRLRIVQTLTEGMEEGEEGEEMRR